MGRHGCLILTFLSGLISHCLFPPNSFQTWNMDCGSSASRGVSASLFLFRVSSVWNSPGPAHCPKESTHFSRPDSKFHLFLEVFTDPQVRFFSSSILLSWPFTSKSVRASITLSSLCVLFISLFSSLSCKILKSKFYLFVHSNICYFIASFYLQ